MPCAAPSTAANQAAWNAMKLMTLRKLLSSVKGQSGLNDPHIIDCKTASMFIHNRE
jgi:hypothetical protein